MVGTRTWVAFTLVGLVAGQGLARSAASAEKLKPIPAGAAAAAGERCACDGVCICPTYIYMRFETYDSWYALHHNSNPVQYCYTPISWDAPSGHPVGNCMDGTNCESAARFRQSAKPQGGSKYRGKHHDFSKKLIDEGYEGNPVPKPSPGSVIIPPRPGIPVNYVRFDATVDGRPQQKLVAKVYWVRITPAKFDLPPDTPQEIRNIIKKQKETERGHGFQVTDAPVPKELPPDWRDVDQDDVQTLDQAGKALILLVRIEDGIWHEYNVVLKKTP